MDEAGYAIWDLGLEEEVNQILDFLSTVTGEEQEEREPNRHCLSGEKRMQYFPEFITRWNNYIVVVTTTTTRFRYNSTITETVTSSAAAQVDRSLLQ